jgi:DnaJ like chaperone protein
MGKGASQDIIDQATEKLQQINEAYELLKERKG